jgi:hypothetical protein
MVFMLEVLEVLAEVQLVVVRQVQQLYHQHKVTMVVLVLLL